MKMNDDLNEDMNIVIFEKKENLNDSNNIILHEHE